MVPKFFGVTNVNATHFIGSNMTELLNIPTSITQNWGKNLRLFTEVSGLVIHPIDTIRTPVNSIFIASNIL